MNRILLVEDDDETRELLKIALEGAGYAVAVAQTGAAAFDALQTQALPRLILADLMMPDVDGWDFLRLLQADARFAAIPVVLLTGWFGELPRGYPVLKKPFAVEELLELVVAHCGDERDAR